MITVTRNTEARRKEVAAHIEADALVRGRLQIMVKQFDRKGAFATYDLIDALSRNPTTIYAGADICAEAKSTILVQADRIEELEAKLAKAMTALVEVREFVKDLEPYAQGHSLVPALQKACTVLAELTGDLG